MKIKVKINDGQIEEYNSIKDLKRYLNELDYYCESLSIVYTWEDAKTYTNKTVLSDLYKEACIYGEGYLKIYSNH